MKRDVLDGKLLARERELEGSGLIVRCCELASSLGEEHDWHRASALSHIIPQATYETKIYELNKRDIAITYATHRDGPFALQVLHRTNPAEMTEVLHAMVDFAQTQRPVREDLTMERRSNHLYVVHAMGRNQAQPYLFDVTVYKPFPKWLAAVNRLYAGLQTNAAEADIEAARRRFGIEK